MNTEEKLKIAVTTLVSLGQGLTNARQSCDREALQKIPILEGEVNAVLWDLGVDWRGEFLKSLTK